MRTRALYKTRFGKAYLGDSLGIMAEMPDASTNLIVTSPPFPLTLQKKKPYESVTQIGMLGGSLPTPGSSGDCLRMTEAIDIGRGGVESRRTDENQYKLLIALYEHLGLPDDSLLSSGEGGSSPMTVLAKDR